MKCAWKTTSHSAYLRSIQISAKSPQLRLLFSKAQNSGERERESDILFEIGTNGRNRHLAYLHRCRHRRGYDNFPNKNLANSQVLCSKFAAEISFLPEYAEPDGHWISVFYSVGIHSSLAPNSIVRWNSLAHVATEKKWMNPFNCDLGWASMLAVCLTWS